MQGDLHAAHLMSDNVQGLRTGPTQINDRLRSLRSNPSVSRLRQPLGRLGRRPPQAAGAGVRLLYEGPRPGLPTLVLWAILHQVSSLGVPPNIIHDLRGCFVHD